MTCLTLTPLLYPNNLLSHYQSLSDLPGFVLLESADTVRGRYDIVAAHPYNTLKLYRDSPNLQDAFHQLEALLPKALRVCDLPFQGGAIGYIAYDLGEILRGIHSTPHPSNDMPLMDIGFYDWAIITDHWLKRVHLVAANTQAETKHHIHEVLTLWNRPTTIDDQTNNMSAAFIPLINRDDYQKAFTTIQQALIQGRSYQVNYTQPFLAHNHLDRWAIYQRVRCSNPVPYSAFLRCDAGDILSFSPERFLIIDNGLVETSPIKGTAKRSSDPIVDQAFKSALKKSEKNRAENTMIVDLLRNDLGQLARPGSVRVTSLCEVQSFNAVHHLVSTIESVSADGVTPLQVFAACFPGGSITGAPKLEAMRIIHEQEPYARGVYCGSIAYFSAHGRIDSNIAIRTVTAKDNTLYLSAGGGIVIDSICDDEYQECFTKISAIINAC